MNVENNMNNTDNKKFKKILLIILIIAVILTVGIVSIVAINSAKQNELNANTEENASEIIDDINEESIEEESTIEKSTEKESKETEKEVIEQPSTNNTPPKEQEIVEEETNPTYKRIFQIANAIRTFTGIGNRYQWKPTVYTSISDVPNEIIAFFIQAVANPTWTEFGYTFNKNDYIYYCQPDSGYNCADADVITDDIFYISSQGANRAYSFDKVRQYAKTCFNRDLKLSDITGEWLKTYKYEGKDFVIDENPGFTGPIQLRKVEELTNNNGIYEARISVNDAEENYSTDIFKFRLLNNSSIDDIKLGNLEIISYEIK